MPAARLAKALGMWLLLAFGYPSVLWAADVRLAWDPPTDGVTTGFIIYYGQSSHGYTHQIDVGNTTTFTVTGLADGQPYFFSVRGYNAGGQLSDFSAEVATAQPNMSVDAPIAGASVTQPLTIAGWAIDAGTGGATPTGIERVDIWACPNACTPTNAIFWGRAAYGQARPDVASAFGDARFTNSGFSLSVTGQSPGTYQLVVYALSSVTGDWQARSLTMQVAGLAVSPTPTAIVMIDAPGSGSHQIQPFAIAGWAVDTSSATGTGVDAVHVWACPGTCTGANALFVGVASYGGARPDVGAALGNSRFTSSSFGLSVRGLAPGPYQMVVYSHSLVTGQWQSASVNVDIATQPLMWIDTPADRTAVSTTVDIAGWALDTASPSGTGVDAVHIWAYHNPGSGTPAVFLGSAALGVSRPDVGQAFGSQFNNAGWTFRVSGHPTGDYQIIVYMHSSVSGVWTARTVSVRMVF